MKQVLSYDLIRAVAIFFVICIHSMGMVNDTLPLESTIGIAHITDAFMCIIYSGVPLFVMLSGALLLGKEEPMRVFFRRRLTRVLIPFLVWSFSVYAILYWQDGGRSLVGFLCSYAFRTLTDGVYGIYWFVYMLIGLYIITPPLRIILNNSRIAVFEFLIAVALTVGIVGQGFPEIKTIGRLYSENSIFVFYYLVGSYMARKRERLALHKFRLRVLFLVLFAVRSVLRTIDVRWEVLDVAMYVSLFVVLLLLPTPRRSVANCVQTVSKYSYGIYLSHFMLISVFLKLHVFQRIPLVIEPICMAISVLLADLAILYALGRMHLRRYVM